MVASATDHATIIKRVLPTPTNWKNMIRLSRVRKSSPLVIKKTVAERAVCDAAILRLGEDSLPPMEVLRGPRA